MGSNGEGIEEAGSMHPTVLISPALSAGVHTAVKTTRHNGIQPELPSLGMHGCADISLNMSFVGNM